jgi:hypothetical protein
LSPWNEWDVRDQEAVGSETRISWIGIHRQNAGAEQSRFLFGLRVVPDGREGNVIFARALGPDEEDAGQEIVLDPSTQTLGFRNGAVSVQIDHVDQYHITQRLSMASHS